MERAEGTFLGADGVSIYWQHAAPLHGPRGTVLIAHGYAEHLGRYGGLMSHLVERGLAVAALDHRGHGRSGGRRGHCRDLDELVADLHALAGMTDRWWPGVPRVLFGHSMGGLVAARYLMRHPQTVCAAALSAPALRLHDQPSRLLTAVAVLLGHLAPWVSFRSTLDAAALSRDPAVGAAYVADPLVHRAITAGLYRALRGAQRDVEVGDPIRVPVLVLQGAADRIVDPSAAADFAARLAGPHELVMLPGYYHELLNEPPPERAKVLGLLDVWIDRWIEPANRRVDCTS